MAPAFLPMTFWKHVASLWLSPSSLLLCSLCFMAWKLYPRAAQIAYNGSETAYNASVGAYTVQTTIQNVNAATGVWSSASQKQADAADELLRDLRAETWHVDRTLTTFNEQMGHVGPLMDSLRAESDELRNTTRAATGLLGEAQTTTKAAQPLLASLQRNSDDINGIIRENAPSLHMTLANVSNMTADGHVILSNAAQVSTKAREDYMKSKTPWGRFVTTGLDLIHLGAYAAR